MGKKTWIGLVGMILLAAVGMVAFRSNGLGTGRMMEKEVKEPETLRTIGFSQVGAESDWRTANSVSMKRTFTPERGYDLLFEDARQLQSNQIMSIRRFIQQEVDYIVFSPVVETGWDTVLEEAKRANIPVIIIDRKVSVKEKDLYTAWVGSDFYLEGRKACSVLKRYVEEQQIPEVNIVNIQGTLGATAQIGRTTALEDSVREYGWNLLAQETGEYTAACAYEVMTRMLQEHDSINFVYCENDNEAFGAIQAIREAGKTVGPGGDIQILSFDATKEGLQKTLSGEILINAECNPGHGHYVETILQQLEAGKVPQTEIYVPENVFVYGTENFEIVLDKETYEIQGVTELLINSRDY